MGRIKGDWRRGRGVAAVRGEKSVPALPGTPARVSPMAGETASILVCCYTFDRFADTTAAVESALDQTVDVEQALVAVDHNPELADELRKALPSSVTFCLNEGERGESATRNAGVAKATGDIVAFLDDDAVAEHDWLENLLAPFENPNTMVVGGRSVPAWERGEAPFWFPREYEFMIGCTGHVELVIADDKQVRNSTGSNMAVRRKALEEIGGWTEELGRGPVKTGGAEADLCLRIKSAIPGSLVVHERTAVVHHKVPLQRSTLKYVFTYAYNEGLVRAMLRQRLSHHTSEPLAGERLYLRRLITRSIPSRLRRFYRPASLAQLAVISINAILIALGYLRGRLAYR